MTQAIGNGATSDACWQKIGVWGDLSCAQLEQHGHCRHCPVYQERGRMLLEQPASEGYLRDWAQLLALPSAATSDDSGVLHVTFRIGQSWLALTSLCLREVLHVQPIRVVPHRRGKILLGLTPVRGEIQLCVSLHELLHEQRDQPPQATQRFIVAGDEAQSWVFPVDDLLGLSVVAEGSLQPPPATLAHSFGAYVSGVFEEASRSIGVLDHELLFRGLERGVS